MAVVRCIKDCAREWNKHRKTGDRFIHADEIRDFLKTDTTVFKYKFGNKWIVNYDQLLPHLKKINRRESKLWKAYMACTCIKKSVVFRKETTDFLACLRRFERPTPALGVLKNSQNPIKISNFRTFLGVLSNIFCLNRLFSFVFSANFRFQNNFQTKIIPKTIPIFIAVFKNF